MLLKPISINYQHEIALQVYLDMITTTIKDVTKNEDKYKDFIDVANIIIEHHNNYRKDVLVLANYQDFISLIPTHFTAMLNGYLTGLENEKNRNSVRLYKHLLSEEAYNFIEKVQDLKIEQDI
tara:strand:+ start:3118 stop:3486 length:369 start_codon:yes stop_codon:yes gene_type:complete